MTFADDVLMRAKAHVGEDYILGSRADFLDANYSGPWDCAEFVSWVIFRASGERVLLGVQPRQPDNADAYTGFWADDAAKYGLSVSVDEAINTKAYLLLRRPGSAGIGHIAFSRGDGKSTIEAHSKKQGVIIGVTDPDARNWDIGVRLPDPADWQSLTATRSLPKNWSLRESAGDLRDPRIPFLVAALRKKGVNVPAKATSFTTGMTKAVAKFQQSKGLVVDGIAGPETFAALGVKWSGAAAPSGTYNDAYGVFFDSLVTGGTYSSDPDDLSVRRSIRTNNPGALNISTWQKSLPGYVGITPPDGSANQNRTTIYRTPEHGVAAWFILLADRYGLAAMGSFTLRVLAKKYAGGGASQNDIADYISGWSNASKGKLDSDSVISTDETPDMLALARAMYFHESGKASPLKDSQIIFGIETQRAGTMPA
jgi:N-acetylmuramoyl-L-alanine amidase